MRTSRFTSEDLRLEPATDLGGLDLELTLLTSLYPDASDDCEVEGVWYGFKLPNSTARFTLLGTGGASPIRASLLGPSRLTPRGGGGLDKSGPIDGLLRCSDPLGLLLAGSSNGFRIIVSGADGLRLGSF